MPTVSRSDCTQVDLTETFKITYDSLATVSPFKGKITSVDVDFNACRGINNRNNDLWAYMAKLYYQGDISAEQFGEAGRIITNDGCEEAVKYQLNKQNLKTGYDHDDSTWTFITGRDSMKLSEGYGNKAFTRSLTQESLSQPNGIAYRACATCEKTHKKIYYRRLTEVPEEFDLLTNLLYYGNNGGGNNVWNEDFTMHSTYDDALTGANPWKCPGNSYNYGAGFPGECSPTGARVRNQQSRFNSSGERNDVAWYVNKPERHSLEIVPTNVIKSRDYAAGAAVEAEDGTIYVTGAGRDIWGNADDFNYYSQPAEGDQTIIVNAASQSTPQGDGWSKAGIMIRQSMDPDSPHASVFLTGNQGVCTFMRSGARYGDPNNKSSENYGCVSTGIQSAWIKLEKRMNTYTSFIGQDDGSGNIDWTVMKSFDIPLMGDSFNVGLAVCSKRWYQMEVVFENYSTDSYYFPSAAPSISSAPTALVPSVDIGAVGLAGSASESSTGTWTVSGSGYDIWGRNDQFHYANFVHSGDVTVTMFVENYDVEHYWAKAGLMIRDTLATNSMHYSLFMTGGAGLAQMWRGCTNCGMGNSQTASIKDSSLWLRVQKVGNVFTASYKKVGGTEWVAFGSTQTMAFTGDSFYVGIANTSHDNAKIGVLKGTNFEVVETTPAPVRKLRGRQ